MKLQIKILCGFAAMVVLMAIISLMNWRGLDTMDRQSMVTAEVNNNLTYMVLAQVGQYQYMLTRSETSRKSTRQNIEQALVAARQASLYLDDADGLRRNNESIAFLQQYEVDFETLVRTLEAASKESRELTGFSNAIMKNFELLRQNLREVFLESNSLSAFTAFELLTKASFTYEEMRISAYSFASAPSRELAMKVVTLMGEVRVSAETALKSMRVARDIALCEETLKSMGLFLAKFDAYAEKNYAVFRLDENIQAELEQNLSSLLALSRIIQQNSHSIFDFTTSMAMVLAGISMLTGLGITVVLGSSVQRHLGKDPGELARIAQRVSDGDFSIDDGSPRTGVYGNIVGMVDAMRAHIENAQQESERAYAESEQARQARQACEDASSEVHAKTERLLATAGRLETVARVVSTASADLASQISQSERGAATQAARVAETATAMGQMNATVLEVAQNADSASQASASTRNRAEAGADVVRHAVDSIRLVQSQAAQLRTDMAALDESARAISQIMSVISDIADQTNLLALNAAIEAARAGETGRGFAVVADEVRKLAEKTMTSTADVSRAIQGIQQAVARSMAQVDASVQAIEDATGYANQSGEALVEIVTMVDNTAGQVRAIAAASEEQSTSSEAINRSITQVNVIARETAETMREATEAVAELARQSQALTGLIEDMKRE